MNNYLNSLKDKIGNLPERYKRQILKDYKNHFQEGLISGKTENDIAGELGDVDYIAKCVISEYYIEHSEEINNVRNILKALYSIKKIGAPTLNLIMVAPIIISTMAIVLSLYIVDFFLLITPIFLLANLIAPNLPIYFGTVLLMGKALTTLLFVVIGYLLYNLLKKWNTKFFSWVFKYIIRSIKFEIININKIS